jgi:hypothetical protein
MLTLDRAVWFGSVVIAAVLFGFLANRHWVPGGDSEVYLSTARNLLLRHFSLRRGYIFNGQPMNMVPPGWPYALALAMAITTRFEYLKLIVLLSMLGSLAIAYPIIRRFAPPLVAGAVVVLTALLSHVFPLTFWLHSDALFCLLGTASFLLALQISEGRAEAWRIILLCILCSAAVTVRWAGLLNWIVVGGILMDGCGLSVGTHLLLVRYWRELYHELRPSLALPSPETSAPASPASIDARAPIDRKIAPLDYQRQSGPDHRRLITPILRLPSVRITLAIFLSFIATMGTFMVWRSVLRVTPQQAAMIREAGGTEDSGMDSRADAMTHQEYSWMNANDAGWRGYVARAFSWGDWFSYLFWQPFRFHAIKWLNTVSVIAGWIVAAPLLYLVYRGISQRQWIWPAVALYAFLLAMSWPHPNARYLVPIAFLLLTSIWTGSSAIAKAWPAAQMPRKPAIALFVFSYVLCNGALYGIEVWAQHSRDFYGTYEAGLNQDLISAGRWLANHHVPANEAIACSERYVNLSTSARTSKLGLRVVTMLTGRPIITIPKRYLKGLAPATQPNGQPVISAPAAPDFIFDPDPVNNPQFLAWARSNTIRYYLYQPPVSPWRALHFRVPWLEERATHMPVVDTGAGWRLYKIPPTGPCALRILPLPAVGDWPLQVPDIER